MKTLMHAFIMCQSMFCAIPAPQVWDEKAKDKMLLFLPLVGLEIGAVWALCVWVCRVLVLPDLVTALVGTVCPYLLTGFIHLDGYMDVTDAVKSWRDLERRREILKDSHVGSFAVIGLAMLMLAQFACFASISQSAPMGVLVLIPALSRCGSALAVTCLKPMSTSQYAEKPKNARHVVLLCAMSAAILVLGFAEFGKYGFALVGCAAGYALALSRAYRSLAGMNGDIAGYSLTFAELAGIFMLAII